eukprot:CAMPEP_0114560764 /NCGR_PEP_ID=MMETSP0114-20121206/11634_1 /TAXON_ID=31324 /ORGANISM="Goniomonas sp, Strain m" /LENGTH=532 /DNA_ID=CAMNT_0001746333 /DNA_START=26 /DNA_END=1625 /DNA_ORIENTATION=-
MAKRISQDTFDDVVKENMEDFDMPLEEALVDAVAQFEAQGVDLSSIVKSGIAANHPVVDALVQIKKLLEGPAEEATEDAFCACLNTIASECGSAEGRAIASTKNAVPTVVDVCFNSGPRGSTLLASGLRALAALSKENHDNQDALVEAAIEQVCVLLKAQLESADTEPAGVLAEPAVELVRHSCRKNEQNRRLFVHYGVTDSLLQCVKRAVAHKESKLAQKACTAARVLTFDDDMRSEWGHAHEHAVKLIESGGSDIMLGMLQAGLEASAVASACATLSRLAVKDMYCKEVVEKGGLNLVVQALEKHGADKEVASQSCLILKSLAGNDDCKSVICHGPTLGVLLATMVAHLPDKHVQENGCSALSAVCLRHPENCTAVVKAGAVGIVIGAMRQHVGVDRVQRQGCMAIRNCIVRNPELISVWLEEGAEDVCRRAMDTHAKCKDVGHAALRDLKVDGVEFKELWKGDPTGPKNQLPSNSSILRMVSIDCCTGALQLSSHPPTSPSKGDSSHRAGLQPAEWAGDAATDFAVVHD